MYEVIFADKLQTTWLQTGRITCLTEAEGRKQYGKYRWTDMKGGYHPGIVVHQVEADRITSVNRGSFRRPGQAEIDSRARMCWTAADKRN